MGTKLRHGRGDDLYSFWGTRVTDQLNRDLERSPGAKVLVNLASQEYFGVVQPTRVDGPIVSPRFLDLTPGGEYKVVSFFAKRARGSMAGWIIRNRIGSPATLVEFDSAGYRYDPIRSTDSEPTFTRTQPV
jgi:cytoplasmic iron level regulating protein YaaA (DUF328/UPF0246 family)